MAAPSTFQVVASKYFTTHPGDPYPHSLDMLPLGGISDPLQTVGEALDRLTRTLYVLDGLRHAPFGLPEAVKQGVENIRFHVINGLSFIDSHRRFGKSVRGPAIDVEGLPQAVEQHIYAIAKVKPAWSAWLADATSKHQPGEPALPPTSVPAAPPLSGMGLGADPAATLDVLQPKSASSWSDYAGLGLAAGCFILAYTTLLPKKGKR